MKGSLRIYLITMLFMSMVVEEVKGCNGGFQTYSTTESTTTGTTGTTDSTTTGTTQSESTTLSHTSQSGTTAHAPTHNGTAESTGISGTMQSEATPPTDTSQTETTTYSLNTQTPKVFLIIPREDWNAREPKNTTDLAPNISCVIIHHTAAKEHNCFDTESCKAAVRSVQNHHMDTKGWSDIGYNFLVGEDGNAYEGRGWLIEGDHAKGCNSECYGISVLGDFTNRLPNAKALGAIDKIIQMGIDQGYISANYKLHGHRDTDNSNTACPGNKLYDWVTNHPRYGGNPPC